MIKCEWIATETFCKQFYSFERKGKLNLIFNFDLSLSSFRVKVVSRSLQSIGVFKSLHHEGVSSSNNLRGVYKSLYCESVSRSLYLECVLWFIILRIICRKFKLKIFSGLLILKVQLRLLAKSRFFKEVELQGGYSVKFLNNFTLRLPYTKFYCS